jgi:hypothetical protein
MVQRDVLGTPVLVTLHTRTNVNGRLLNLLFLPGTTLWSTPTLNFITFSYSPIAKGILATGRWKRGRTKKTEPESGEGSGSGRGRGTLGKNRVRRSSGHLHIKGTALRRVVAPLSERGLLPFQHLQTNLKGFEKTASAATALPHAGSTFLLHHAVHVHVLGTKAETGSELTCPEKSHLPGDMSQTLATQTSQPLSTPRLFLRNLQSHHRCSHRHHHLKSPRYRKCPPLLLISRDLHRQKQHPKG